jgi:hypothetical protein
VLTALAAYGLEISGAHKQQANQGRKVQRMQDMALMEEIDRKF